jgi:uncharacterized protein YndB with AHSA1/START domain
MTGIVATAQIDIAAPATAVWSALVEPAQIKQYMFGSTVETDWRAGSTITWSGEYNGQRYQDEGEIIAIDAPRRLELTHFSAMSGAKDAPENYHRLIYTLTPIDDGTRVRLTQDNNPDNDAATHASRNWHTMLTELKRHLEDPRTRAGVLKNT